MNPFGTFDDNSSSSLATVNVEDDENVRDRRKSVNPFIEDDTEEIGNDNIVAEDIYDREVIMATVTLTPEAEAYDYGDTKVSRRMSTNPWGDQDEEGRRSDDDDNNSQLNSGGYPGDQWEGEGTIISDITDMDLASVVTGGRAGGAHVNARKRMSQPLVFQSSQQGTASYFIDMKDAPEDVKDYNFDCGYWNGNAYEAVYNECDQSHVGARIAMKKKVISAYERKDVATLDNLWKSPISVRVSSWLPNIQDPESQELHTGYFATIQLTSRPTHQWQVIARFGKFYQLYLKLKKASFEKLFLNGMACPFPEDRWKTKIFGVSDDTRDWRQKALDGWFRELVMSPKVMLDVNLRKSLFEFFEVDKNKAIASEIQVLPSSSGGASVAAATVFSTGSSIARRMSAPVNSSSTLPQPQSVPIGY